MNKKSKIALALVAILLASVVFAPVPGNARWLRDLHDTAHGPIFGCVAVLLLILMRAQTRINLPLWRQYGLAFAVAVALGFATELIQGLTGRDATLSDAVRDALGALAFLGIFWAVDQRMGAVRSIGARWAVVLVSVGLLVAVTMPATHAVIAYGKRGQQFPVLADFSRKLDDYFLASSASTRALEPLPAEWAVEAGERALLVRLEEEPFAGLHFVEPYPDWTGYSALCLDLTNPGESELLLTLRVHDAMHNNLYTDRYNKAFVLPPRTRRVFKFPLAEIASAPAGRQMDLRRIAQVILFRGDPSPARELYISKMWLERSQGE
ncbi:MAG TPA: hypothetical protein VF193_00225 [Steroidobacter sp.]